MRLSIFLSLRLVCLLGALVFANGFYSVAHADTLQVHSAPVIQYLPVGSQCHGQLPCETSGDYGIHFRVQGSLELDKEHRVRQGLLAPAVIVSAMQLGELGVALPVRFYDAALPVPERLRVFGKLSLPKTLLPSASGAVFANVNWSLGALDEAGAPTGRRSTTVDAGAVVGGELSRWLRARAALWTTLGQPQPQLHAGAELSVRLDAVLLYCQIQFQNHLETVERDSRNDWGLLGTFGILLFSSLSPSGAYVSAGHGAAVPAMIVGVETGVSYDVEVRKRYGDGHAAAEQFWYRAAGPLSYRLRLHKRGYFDPYPDQNGLLRDDVDHSVLGILGVPDPQRPGYILTPSGLSIPVGTSLEIRNDKPFVTSAAFPGKVLTYIPLSLLTPSGRALPSLDPWNLAQLEEERRFEELLVQDELRRIDTPWAKAALNAAVGLLTDPLNVFVAAASPNTPELQTLRRQTRSLPYPPGYEEYKGEIAEAALQIYGSTLLGWGVSPARLWASATAREVAAGIGQARRVALAETPGVSGLWSSLAPRLNPGNYHAELRGLGSNFGNLKVEYAGAKVAQSAEGAVVETEVAASTPAAQVSGKVHGEAGIEREGLLRRPAERHSALKVKQKTLAKEKNTVIEPAVEVQKDVAAINEGEATRTGDTFTVNGRTYGMHDGTLYPISGQGFHPLDRGAFKALGVLNEFGPTERAFSILEKMGISNEQRAAALRVYEVIHP